MLGAAVKVRTQVAASDDAAPARIALHHRVTNEIVLGERLIIVVDLRVFTSDPRHRHEGLVRHFGRAALVAEVLWVIAIVIATFLHWGKVLIGSAKH